MPCENKKAINDTINNGHWMLYRCWSITLLFHECCCCVASVVSDPVRPHGLKPTGFSVHGILQARTLEWVAISFSNAWKWKVKVKLLSRVWLLATPWTAAQQAPPSMGFSRQEYQSGLPLPSPLFPWPGIKSGPPELGACRVLAPGPPGKSHVSFFKLSSTVKNFKHAQM